MKLIHRLFITMIFIGIGCVSYAQRPLEVQMRTGIGLGVYGTTTSITNGNEKWTEQSGAVTRVWPLDFRWEINQRWLVGAQTQFGSYLYGNPDPNYTNRSNRLSVFGVAGEFNIITKEKFRWYTGIGITLSNLRIEQSRVATASSSTSRESFFLRGGGTRFNTGLIRWFGNSPIGLHFQVGFDRHRYKVREIKVDGSIVNTADFQGTLKAGGVDFQLGLALRIRR